jgi:Protein of unknown function (DUF1573).
MDQIKYRLIVLYTFVVGGIYSQNATFQNNSLSSIAFETTRHDFGTIAYNGNGTYNYVFINTGTIPLVILNCVKGCGCTSVSWTKEPVASGKKGIVTATYNTKHVGYFNKGVDVFSNTATSKINLRLIGTVAEPTDEQIKKMTKKDGPKISFEKQEYNLGSFQAGSPVVCEIKFLNTGTTNLNIINCIKGKGIVDLVGNRQTIAPGQEGTVKITCKSNIAGHFATNVVFYSNIEVPVAIHVNGEIVQ